MIILEQINIVFTEKNGVRAVVHAIKYDQSGFATRADVEISDILNHLTALNEIIDCSTDCIQSINPNETILVYPLTPQTPPPLPTDFPGTEDPNPGIPLPPEDV